MIRQILNDGWGPLEVELDAVNRRGRAIRVRIETISLTDSTGEVTGAALVMDDYGAA